MDQIDVFLIYQPLVQRLQTLLVLSVPLEGFNLHYAEVTDALRSLDVTFVNLNYCAFD